MNVSIKMTEPISLRATSSCLIRSKSRLYFRNTWKLHVGTSRRVHTLIGTGSSLMHRKREKNTHCNHHK